VWGVVAVAVALPPSHPDPQQLYEGRNEVWSSNGAKEALATLELTIQTDPKFKPEPWLNFSSTTHITRHSPTTISVHGQHDSVLPWENSEYLHDVLDANGVPNALVLLPLYGHGMNLGVGQLSSQIMAFAFDRLLARADWWHPSPSPTTPPSPLPTLLPTMGPTQPSMFPTVRPQAKALAAVTSLTLTPPPLPPQDAPTSPSLMPTGAPTLGYS